MNEYTVELNSPPLSDTAGVPAVTELSANIMDTNNENSGHDFGT